MIYTVCLIALFNAELSDILIGIIKKESIYYTNLTNF